MMESLLIACACTFVVLAALWLHIRVTKYALDQSIVQLDAQLAAAIKSSLDQLPIGDVEPVNPLQLMLMQIIQDNMSKNPAKIVNRDEKGLFTAESESKSEK